jgi:hypothetical protein
MRPTGGRCIEESRKQEGESERRKDRRYNSIDRDRQDLYDGIYNLSGFVFFMSLRTVG